MELSRARLLAERLAGSEQDVSLPTLSSIQRELGKTTALLAYANADWKEIVKVAVTQRGVRGRAVSAEKYLKLTSKKNSEVIRKHLEKQRDLKLVKKKEDNKLAGRVETKKDDLEKLINYYKSDRNSLLPLGGRYTTR